MVASFSTRSIVGWLSELVFRSHEWTLAVKRVRSHKNVIVEPVVDSVNAETIHLLIIRCLFQSVI